MCIRGVFKSHMDLAAQDEGIVSWPASLKDLFILQKPKQLVSSKTGLESWNSKMLFFRQLEDETYGVC